MCAQDMGSNIAAVILAAGYSSRMKKFKALLPVGEEPAIERVIHSAKGLGIDNIVVVTGYQREKLSPILQKEKVTEAYNPIFDAGMFSSIQTGTKAVMETGAEGFLLMPVDCPVVRDDVLKKIYEKAQLFLADRATQNRFIVPCYLGKKGHPLFVPICYGQEIINHDGRRGFKYITDKYEDSLVRMETGSESVILDMDDEKGYEEVCAYYQNGCREENLSDLVGGRRFILIRHGQIRQHKEKIFLGQSDIPLSEKGVAQAKEAGQKLLSLHMAADRIYSSDLSRAADTAGYIGEILKISVIQHITEFREMALGAWDGKFISEIAKKYPDAYEKRGKDLYKFKFDHESENFYDLQYRVLKGFKKILKSDKNRDVLIVAHSGVLRVIANALSGKDVSDGYTKIGNGEFLIIEKD